jgi:hypothetical protein
VSKEKRALSRKESAKLVFPEGHPRRQDASSDFRLRVAMIREEL